MHAQKDGQDVQNEMEWCINVIQTGQHYSDTPLPSPVLSCFTFESLPGPNTGAGYLLFVLRNFTFVRTYFDFHFLSIYHIPSLLSSSIYVPLTLSFVL